MNKITFANLTPESFMILLKQAVDKRGEDYVYPEEHKTENAICRYSYNGEPDCIIGEVIYSIDPNSLPPMDLERGAYGVLSDLGVDNEEVKDLANLAQTQQDIGVTWGTAYSLAKHHANNCTDD